MDFINTGVCVSEPIVLTSSTHIPLGSCPMDANSVSLRTITMNNFSGCPKDTKYICGKDITKKFLVESCQPNLRCNPGFSFQFVIDAELKIHLECRACPDDRFEPDSTESANHSVIPGCTYRHLPPEELSSNLVLFEMGNKSTATKWMCNYKEGYYERNGNLICNDARTHSCDCMQKTCSAGYLLRTDGQCVKCSTHLVPNENFICYNPKRKKQVDQSDNHLTPAVERIRSDKKAQNATTPSPNKDDDGLSTGPILLIVGLAVVILIIGLGLGLVCWLCRRRIGRVFCPQYSEKRAGSNEANDPENLPEVQTNRTDQVAERPVNWGPRDGEETQHLNADHSYSHVNNTEHFSPQIGNSNIRLTGNNIQARDINIVTVNVHNGEINMPNGMGSMPNGTTHMPNGTTPMHNGATAMHNGTTPVPDGTTSMPNGTTNTVCDSSGEEEHLRMKTLKYNFDEEDCVTDSSNLQMQILKECQSV